MYKLRPPYQIKIEGIQKNENHAGIMRPSLAMRTTMCRATTCSSHILFCKRVSQGLPTSKGFS
eukprot:Pgem_evm1s8867